jgi:uncharacterized protein (TIRG00374 family)
MKKNLLNIIIILITAVALFVLVFSSSGSKIYDVMANLKLNWMLFAVLGMIVYWLLEGVILQILCLIQLGNYRFYNSLRFSMMGQFFNAITPFSSGGQPIQAWCMIRNGIKPGHTLSILVIRSMIFQLCMLVYSIVIFIFQAKYFVTYIDRFLVFFIVGIVANTLMLFLYILFLFNKSAAENVVQAVFRFLKKIKLIKRPEKYVHKIEVELESFSEGVNACKGKLKDILKILFLQFLQFTAFYSIAFFIYRAIENGKGQFFYVSGTNAILYMVTFLVPSPGASGGAEGMGYLFFRHFFSEGHIAPFILIMRTITFYFNIIFGGLVSALSPEKPFKSSEAVEEFPMEEGNNGNQDQQL